MRINVHAIEYWHVADKEAQKLECAYNPFNEKTIERHTKFSVEYVSIGIRIAGML